MLLPLLVAATLASLSVWQPKPAEGDWLLGRVRTAARVTKLDGKEELVLSNGLVSRRFKLSPGFATVGFDNLMTGDGLLRAIRPEAVVDLDGKTYPVGGLVGQPDLAFLRDDWITAMKPQPGSFRFIRYETGPIRARFPSRPGRHASNGSWPPKGVELTLWFDPPAEGPRGIRVAVHYELLDGMPLFSKWLTIHNDGSQPVRLKSFVVENLGLVEGESVVDANPGWRMPNLTVVTDYSFGGMAMNNSNRTVYWEPDPEYKTQVNYELKTPCVLQVRPPLGPDVDIPAGGSLDSFRAFELIQDSTDRERNGLAVRKMFRTLAPWSTENPLMLHLTSTDPAIVHTAIDQAAECGFEMIIISFWSGLDMEDVSDANLAKFKGFVDYAHSKGLQLGGYSLLASRRIDDANDVISPKSGKPDDGAIFGSSPCLQSKWGIEYFAKLRKFIGATGFDLLEHDGSYPGDVCASTTHPGHKGLEDSQWTQFQEIAEFYRWCRARGMYLNVPDNYFLAGSNKTAMGYRESNWSLPRDQQQIHARQNLFDGTWEKTPSMGWMMVPLVEYQGGGPAATIEPLKDHLPDYEGHLANNLGYGAQACYRGPRLFDSPVTKAVVVEWVIWFKKHRDILESDVVHLRRADGRRIDGILHANPALDEKGLAMFFNPTNETLTEEFDVPLYYTGLAGSAMMSTSDGKPVRVKLDANHVVKVKVTVPANGRLWYVFRGGDKR